MEVKLRCPTCGRGGKNEFRDVPDLEIAAYEDIVEWSAMEGSVPPLNENNWWLRSEKLPEIGEKRAVFVRHPFNENGDSCFWTLYFPAASSINGWEEHPEEIDQSAFIECRLDKVITSGELSAWIQVEVVGRIMLSDAQASVQVSNETVPITNSMYQFDNFELLKFEDWWYYSGSAQGDLGNWILLKQVGKGLRLIAYGEWAFHQYCTYLGNVSVSDSTLEELRSWSENA